MKSFSFNRILLVSSILLVVFISISLADDETSIVIAEGIAIIQGENITGAQERAKNDALRQALEQGVGMIMDAESDLINDDLMEKIHTHSKGYIQKYKIIKEGKDRSGLYRVKIRAVAQKGILRDTLTQLGLIQQLVDYPRIMILPFPDQAVSKITETAETVLIQNFTDKQFDLVDPAKSKQLHNEAKALLKVDTINNVAATIGLKHQAEIVVLFGVESGNSRFDGMMESTTVTIATKAIVTTTAQILTVSNLSASGLGKTSDLALNSAAKNTAEKTCEKTIPAIVSWWDNYTANGLPYIITLNTPPKSDRLIIQFQQNIESIPGVVSLSERSSGGGITEMMVKYKGKSTDLKRAILSEMFKYEHFNKLHTVVSKGRFIVYSLL